MPPKIPLQAKDITRIASSIKEQFFSSPVSTDYDKNNSSNEQAEQQVQLISQNPAKNFASNINPVKPFLPPATYAKSFAASENLTPFDAQTFLERLGVKNISYRKPLTPIEKAKRTLSGIEEKYAFDEHVPAKVKSNLIRAIRNLTLNENTSPIVMDALNVASSSESVEKIPFIEDPRTPLTNNGAMFAPPAKALLVYNVGNNSTTQDHLRSFVHASAYALQYDMKIEGAFDSETMLDAFSEDLKRNNSNNNMTKQFTKDVLSARNANQSTIEPVKIASEIHARFVEEKAFNSDGIEQAFPTVAKAVETIHQKYRAIGQEQEKARNSSFMQR